MSLAGIPTRFLCVIAMLAAGLFICRAQAATTQSTLSGRVLDANGAAIAGATITALPADSAAASTSTTNQKGEFSLTLESGRCSLKVVAAGFSEASLTVDLKQTDAERLEIVLQVAGATAMVTGACAKATKACKDWLNGANFATNGLGTFGNTGKGQFRYPGLYLWDMGLSKTFSVTERFKLQLRGEFFNIFNHVNFDESAATGNFAKFSTGKDNGNFGALTTALDPRIGQIALKVIF